MTNGQLEELPTLEDAELDIDEVKTKIASLEADLLDVSVTMESIDDQGGVARSQIEPYLHYLPNDFPLESFTKSPSTTNLETAQITLESRTATILAAIATAIAALIAKLVHWLFQRSKKEKKVEDQKEEAVDSIRANAGAVHEGAKGKVSELSKIRQRYNEQHGSSWNAFAELVFTHKHPLVNKLFKVQRTVVIGHTAMVKDTLKFLLEVIDKAKKVQGDFGDEMSVVSELSTVQSRVKTQVRVLKDELGDVGVDGVMEAESTKELFQAIKRHFDQLSEQAATQAFDIDKFTTQVVEQKIDLLANRVEDYDFRYEDRAAIEAGKDLKAVGNDLKKLSFDDIPNDTVRRVARDAMKVLNEEVSAIYLYQKLIPKIVDVETRFVKTSYDYFREIGEEIRK